VRSRRACLGANVISMYHIAQVFTELLENDLATTTRSQLHSMNYIL